MISECKKRLWGITTAPKTLIITTIEPFGKDGVIHPVIAEFQSICTNDSSYRNDKPMIDTKAIIHFSIILYELVYNIIKTKAVTRIAPALMGISNNMFKAIAPPKISANDVEIDASMADDRIIFEYAGFM